MIFKQDSDVRQPDQQKENGKNNAYAELRVTIISTVVATLITTFIISIVGGIYESHCEHKELINSINSLYIGCSKKWIEEKLGAETFTDRTDELYECVYVTDIAAIRVFYDNDSDSCRAFFVTALNKGAANKLRLPNTYDYITDGKALGKFSYYDVLGCPAVVYGYYSNGSGRTFYLEEYGYGAGNYYTYYFISMDYGFEWGTRPFGSMLVETRNIFEVDTEVSSRQFYENSMLVVSNRSAVRPNTYGISDLPSEQILELISDYRSFDSKQISQTNKYNGVESLSIEILINGVLTFISLLFCFDSINTIRAQKGAICEVDNNVVKPKCMLKKVLLILDTRWKLPWVIELIISIVGAIIVILLSTLQANWIIQYSSLAVSFTSTILYAISAKRNNVIVKKANERLR